MKFGVFVFNCAAMVTSCFAALAFLDVNDTAAIVCLVACALFAINVLALSNDY